MMQQMTRCYQTLQKSIEIIEEKNEIIKIDSILFTVPMKAAITQPLKY
jgi:hypothetical protein